MSTLTVIIRSTHVTIHNKITKTSTGQVFSNLAGLTLTGLHTVWFILGMDIAALYLVNRQKHEYYDAEIDNQQFNLYIVYITFTIDAVIALQQLTCIVYLCCTQFNNAVISFIEHAAMFFILPYFYAVFGTKIHARIWEGTVGDGVGHQQKDTKSLPNIHKMWVLTGIMVAPLFCLASHAGYILVAWVTEPEKTTATFLGALGCFLYMFFVFRHCYMVHKEPDGLFKALPRFENANQQTENANQLTEDEDDNCLTGIFTCRKYWYICGNLIPLLIPIYVIASHICNYVCILCGTFIGLERCTPSKDANDFVNEFKVKEEKEEKSDMEKEFQMKGFCMAFSWGWLVVGTLALVIAAFTEIPVSTYRLAENLESVVQIIIVLLGFLISYKLITNEDSDIKKFMRKLRRTYTKGKPNSNLEDEDVVEAGGIIAGEVALKLDTLN